MHARALSRLARGAEARQALDRALAVLEPLGPTPALARTVEYLAAVQWHDGANAEAIETCDRAAALAKQLDLPDVLSDVLNTRACSMMSLDQDWVPTMRRALAVGLDAGCDEQVGRAFMNYYGGLVDAGRLDDSEQVFADGMAFCEEREVVTAGHFLRLEPRHRARGVGALDRRRCRWVGPTSRTRRSRPCAGWVRC